MTPAGRSWSNAHASCSHSRCGSRGAPGFHSSSSCAASAGSGKSTLAAELSRRSGLPHLSSDHVRKELAGMSPDTRGPPELYTPEFTEPHLP